MTAANRLESMQRNWLRALTAPDGLRKGLERTPHFEAEALFVSPPGGGLAERLRVYADGYWERLVECLRTEFAGLHELLGDELFTFFARAYLAEHPPRSRTLYDVGSAFPAFLVRTQRRRRAAGAHQRPELLLAVELARLERAAAEIAYARGLEVPSHDRPAACADPFGSPDALITVPPTTRSFAMHARLDAFAPPYALPASDGSPAFIVLWRHRYRVMRQELQPWQFFALRTCARRPRALVECAAAVARRTGQSVGGSLAKLALWLPVAHDASMLAFHTISRD